MTSTTAALFDALDAYLRDVAHVRIYSVPEARERLGAAFEAAVGWLPADSVYVNRPTPPPIASPLGDDPTIVEADA